MALVPDTHPLLAREPLVGQVLDALPLPVLLLDARLAVVDANRAACELLAGEGGVEFKRLCGDALHCTRALASAGGCGSAEACAECALRQSATAALAGELTARRTHRMRIVLGRGAREVCYLVTAAPIEFPEGTHVMLTVEDATELTALREILSICSSCKKVHVGDAAWEGLEPYLSRRTAFDFSHGLCPDCEGALYPGLR